MRPFPHQASEELSELQVVLGDALGQLQPLPGAAACHPLVHEGPHVLNHQHPLGLLLQTLGVEVGGGCR